jgi:hypothetical protein
MLRVLGNGCMCVCVCVHTCVCGHTCTCLCAKFSYFLQTSFCYSSARCLALSILLFLRFQYIKSVVHGF